MVHCINFDSIFLEIKMIELRKVFNLTKVIDDGLVMELFIKLMREGHLVNSVK